MHGKHFLSWLDISVTPGTNRVVNLIIVSLIIVLHSFTFYRNSTSTALYHELCLYLCFFVLTAL